MSEVASLSAPDSFEYVEVRGALGDGVRQLVRVDVEGAWRAAMNCDAVAVAVDHLRAVPERVVVAGASSAPTT